MKHILAGLIFFGFVIVGLIFARRGSLDLSECKRKRGVNFFLVYLLGASFAAGILQKNAWPFADWPLIARAIPQKISQYRIVVMDSTGREYDVDYRAWEPLIYRDFAQWFVVKFPKLEPAVQEQAAGQMLEGLEAARVRARNGERIGTVRRILGPLSAPYFLLHPKIWSEPDSVPAYPLAGLRTYFYEWDLIQRADDPTRFTRTLYYEYRRQP